jgi:hypothetical protein
MVGFAASTNSVSNGSLWVLSLLKQRKTVIANRKLIASTTVPGTFNPASANYFDSDLNLAGAYTDSEGNTGVAIFFGNGDGSFNRDPCSCMTRLAIQAKASMSQTSMATASST